MYEREDGVMEGTYGRGKNEGGKRNAKLVSQWKRISNNEQAEAWSRWTDV
jgi:hypothetical protein